MYFSHSLSKGLVSVFILAIQLLLIRTVSSLNLTNVYLDHKCRVNEGKYHSGSKYEENFNSLVRDMSSYKFPGGFEHINFGDAPNSVNIIFQCRGDSYGSNCRPCFATAIAGLRRRCERFKGGTIWYDQCFLDVSAINRRPPRKIDYENAFSMHNPKKLTGDTELFNKKIRELLYKLMLEANRLPKKDGEEPIFYASGQESIATNRFYAMVQCAKDIALCKKCIEWSIGEVSKCCGGKQGARVLSTTCSLRYELYPFLRNQIKSVW